MRPVTGGTGGHLLRPAGPFLADHPGLSVYAMPLPATLEAAMS
ncbi:hypothetical protein [Streptomyces sp. NPDC094437]